MPERPDLEYVIPILKKGLQGLSITSVALHKPLILRQGLAGSFEELLLGQRFVDVKRHLHFVRFCLDGSPRLEFIVHPMLAGVFALSSGKMSQRARGLSLGLEDGSTLLYRDRVQMGKVYLTPPERWDLIPGYQPEGLDVLDSKRFTLDAFKALAKSRRDQVKVFLLDKSVLDSLGNAYADEVLFAAGIHPKTFVRKLGDEELERLHEAIVSVLLDARKRVAEHAGPIDEKFRDFLKVRNRHKEPCPTCGTSIRKAGVRGHDAFFCPSCQPIDRATGIVRW